MRILVISPFKVFPVSSGFASRSYNLLKGLSNYHDITLLFTSYPKDEAEKCSYLPTVEKFNVVTRSKWGQIFNPRLLYAGLCIIRKDKIELIFAESLWAGLHAILLHILTGVPYFLDEQNAEYIRWKRLYMSCSFCLRLFEKYCCKCAYKVFCVSDDDRRFLSQIGVVPNKIIVIKNGVDIDKFKPNPLIQNSIKISLNISSSNPMILFIGSLSYLPNIQAVEIIKTHILPATLKLIPNAKFVIVGSNPHEFNNGDSIIFTGFVENIEDYINASDVVIAPLISGGGTKLKVIEALSCGKKVITTSIGAEGLIDEHFNNALLVTDEWDTFIELIVDSLKGLDDSFIDPAEFMESYSWDILSKLISDEFEDSLNHHI